MTKLGNSSAGLTDSLNCPFLLSKRRSIVFAGAILLSYLVSWGGHRAERPGYLDKEGSNSENILNHELLSNENDIESDRARAPTTSKPAPADLRPDMFNFPEKVFFKTHSGIFLRVESFYTFFSFPVVITSFSQSAAADFMNQKFHRNPAPSLNPQTTLLHCFNPQVQTTWWTGSDSQYPLRT